MVYRVGIWPLWMGIPVLLAGACSLTAEDVSGLKWRLLQEAPQAWKNYEEFDQTLQGSSRGDRRELTGNDKGQVTRRGTSQWKHCKGHRLLQQEMFDRGNYRAAVSVYNPQYKFSLTRSSEQKPWAVRELIKRSPDAELPEEEPPLALSFGEPPRFLPLLFDSPDFKVIDVITEARNGEELARMIFTYTPKDGQQKNLWGGPRSGWLILDPNHDWVIRGGEIEITWDDKTKIQQKFASEFKEGSGHHLIATKFSLKSAVMENGRITHEHEIRSSLDLHEQKAIPENEFTLRAFGFPEPPWLKPKKTPWYLWAALAGILCLVAGATLRWVKRRRLRANPAMGG